MRKHSWVKYIVIIAFFILGAQLVVEGQTKDPLQPSIASKILRFHVLANSDSEADQNLKLKVRDSIGGLMQEKLADTTNIEESCEIVRTSIPEIVQVAEDTIAEAGKEYPVTAQITTTSFPKKTYGEYTFPAGDYKALEVVIGEGEGHNWWCVLYPNMCFHDSVYEVVDEESKEKLKAVLTTEEYEDVFSSGKYEVHLKFLDFLQ